MQLKAFINKMASEKNITPQLVLQNYMIERLVERISLSPYRNNFILKGGFLIGTIIGIDSRPTMDLDTTIRGFTLTHEAIERIFREICCIYVEDDVSFDVLSVSDIRDGDDYPGVRVSLKAEYLPISVPLTVDITTGDVLTPDAIEYSFALLFDDRKISVPTYNLETILGEKLETILSRNVASTRLRDFYDVYILYSLRKDNYDRNRLRTALEATAEKRGSKESIYEYKEILEEIRRSDFLRKQWNSYIRKYNYANGILFDEVCQQIHSVLAEIM